MFGVLMFTEIRRKVEKVFPTLTEEQIEKIDSALKITAEEHAAMQNMQSFAFADDKISMEISFYLFKTLGGSHTVFNGQKLIERYIAMSLVKEIAAIK